MKVIVDDKIPYIENVLEPYGVVEYIPGAQISAESVKDADALIIRTRTICNEELLKNSSVRFIATATIGFDHIDTDYCQKHNILWTNCPGCNSGSVKQYLTSALLSLAIRHNISFKGKTLGIIGVGNVGSKVAGAARALGMKVILNDPPRARKEGDDSFTDLDELLTHSDFVTVHTPLNMNGTDKTYHLADNTFFQKMKPSAFYINTSRGPTANNLDLKLALQEKTIAGAVLDVWENEPHIDIELLKLLEYATPHIAGYSKDGKANGTSMSIQAASEELQLPLKEWYPNNVPMPVDSTAIITPESSIEQELFKAVKLSYDIHDDDLRLRNNTDSFEEQRGNYPLRREFEHFSFNAHSARNHDVSQILSDLGFVDTVKLT